MFYMDIPHADFNILAIRTKEHSAYIQKALDYVVGKYGGTINPKANELYINHPIRVANCFQWSKDLQVIALLHDVLEDTTTVHNELFDLFPSNVAKAVVNLTRIEGQSWNDYIKLVGSDPYARNVKCADLIDNMNLTRMQRVTIEDARRQRKYAEALVKLMEE